MTETERRKPNIVAERNEMPRQDPEVRRNNFSEVALGYSPEQAKAESERCLQCKNARCVSGCPVEVRIPEFILALREGRMWDSVEALKDKNNLPAICGRSARKSRNASNCASWVANTNRWLSAGSNAMSPTGSASRASRPRPWLRPAVMQWL